MTLRFILICLAYIILLTSHSLILAFPFIHSNLKIAQPYVTALVFLGPFLFLVLHTSSQGKPLTKYIVPLCAWSVVGIMFYVLIYAPFTLGREPFDFHRTITAYGRNPVLDILSGIMFMLFCLPLIFPLRSFSLFWYTISGLPFVLFALQMVYFMSLKTPRFVG